MSKFNWRVVFAGLFPVTLLAAGVLGCAASALLVAKLAQTQGLSSNAQWGCAVTAAALCSYFALRSLSKLNITWFLRVTNFSAQHARNEWPELATRTQLFADRVEGCLLSDLNDEVLIVGYSAGSILGVSVLHKLQSRASLTQAHCSKLAFVTLGNCIPALAALPRSITYRAELRVVATGGVLWVDYTSPADWGSFALTNPVLASERGTTPDDASTPMPQLKSPQFHLLFDSAQYKRIKRNKYRMHQQYLMATQIAGDYDYFALTAGTQSLAERLHPAHSS